MSSTRFVSRLLVAALACAAFASRGAAQRRPAEASAERARAEQAAPRTLWKDIRVEFEGNRLFSSERLRELMNGCYGKDEPEFSPEKFDYCLRTGVLGFVRRSGYLRAQVGTPRAERTWAGETLTVPLDEKELYRVGRVQIEGAEFFTPARLRELLPLKGGDIADGVALVRWLGEHVQQLYGDEGFIQYQFAIEPEFHLDTANGEGVADFKVTVVEGKRFKLRRVTFASSAELPEEALRGALRLREGEFFRLRELREAVQRLNQLEAPGWDGRFDIVDADSDTEFLTDEETAELDIKIRLTERRGERPGREAGRPEATDGGAHAKPSLVRRPQTREE